MNILGKTTINPFVFYTGKGAGYLVWVAFFLALLNVYPLRFNPDIINKYASYLLLVIGVLLMFLSILNLGDAVRVGLPAEETKLKTAGLYKFSRNPMYTGFHLTVIAAMIYSTNLWIILLGAYSIITYHFIVLGEEKFLEDRFGDQYRKYKIKVRRYF